MAFFYEAICIALFWWKLMKKNSKYLICACIILFIMFSSFLQIFKTLLNYENQIITAKYPTYFLGKDYSTSEDYLDRSNNGSIISNFFIGTFCGTKDLLIFTFQVIFNPIINFQENINTINEIHSRAFKTKKSIDNSSKNLSIVFKYFSSKIQTAKDDDPSRHLGYILSISLLFILIIMGLKYTSRFCCKKINKLSKQSAPAP